MATKSIVVKTAIGELADAVETLELAVEAMKDTVGPVPDDAEPHELRRAAYNCQTAAVQIAWLAITIGRIAGALQASADVASRD